MDCEQASERLPWLLNGTLAAPEEAAVRAHVLECARCREDWEETCRAAEVFAAHLPAQAILDLAWERPSAADPRLAKAHLASCRSCAEDLALARESRTLADEDSAPAAGPVVAKPGRRGGRPLPWLGVAAALAVAFSGGAWWGARSAERKQLAAGEHTALLARVASLEAAQGRLREAARNLEVQLEGLRSPLLNVPVFELVAGGSTTRSGTGAANELAIAADARFVVLLLTPETRAPGVADVEIRDERGAPVWAGSGLAPGPLGGYTLAIPAALVGPGRYSVRLRTERPASTLLYPFSIRRPR